MADNASTDTSVRSTKQMLDELDALMERMLSLPVSELGDAPLVAKDVAREPALSASLTLLETPPAPPPRPVPRPMPPEPMVAAPELDVVAPVAPEGALPPAEATFISAMPPAPIGAVIEAPPPPPTRPLERRARTKSAHLPTNGPHFTTIPSKPTMLDPSKIRPESSAAPAPSVAEVQPLTNDVLPPTRLPELDPLLAQASLDDVPVHRRRFTPLLSINQAFDSATEYLGSVGSLLRSVGGRMVLGFSGMVLIMAAAGWVLMDFLGWNW